MASFTTIYNDVFVNEKPHLVSKYFLCGVELVEVLPRDEIDSIFEFYFTKDTSREIQYLKSKILRKFMISTAKVVKRNESAEDDSVIYGANGNQKKKKGAQSECSSKEDSIVGIEFFFSNVMVKIFFAPLFFGQEEAELAESHDSEGEERENNRGSFIIMYYEKSTRKRTFAKNNHQKLRIKKIRDLKRSAVETKSRMIEDSFYSRENKMRRFANYFVTLFNMGSISPFSQFIEAQLLQDLKDKVRSAMEDFALQGEVDASK